MTVSPRRRGREHSRGEGAWAVVGALAANLAIALTKYICAIASGSAAMLAEAIHSTVDSGNEFVLLYGNWRSKKPADDRHPYGHGKDAYFFTLIVAVLLFGVGGGMTLLEGIEHLRTPRLLVNLKWNLVVIVLAIVFETASLVIGVRELRAEGGEGQRLSSRGGLLRMLVRSKDAPTMSVVVEDSAALVGLVIALVGVLANHYLGWTKADALASMAIGVLLCTVAIFLAYETHGLLIGEAASPQVIAEIRAIAEADPAVRSIRRLLTMHLGPDEILLNLEVVFEEHLAREGIRDAIDRLERKVRQAVPRVADMFISGSFSADPRRSPEPQRSPRSVESATRAP